MLELWLREGMRTERVVAALDYCLGTPYPKRLHDSMRRECVDRTIVFSASHLRRILAECVAYDNESRTHLPLKLGRSATRPVQTPNHGNVSLLQFGELYHRCDRRAFRLRCHTCVIPIPLFCRRNRGGPCGLPSGLIGSADGCPTCCVGLSTSSVTGHGARLKV